MSLCVSRVCAFLLSMLSALGPWTTKNGARSTYTGNGRNKVKYRARGTGFTFLFRYFAFTHFKLRGNDKSFLSPWGKKCT